MAEVNNSGIFRNSIGIASGEQPKTRPVLNDEYLFFMTPEERLEYWLPDLLDIPSKTIPMNRFKKL